MVEQAECINYILTLVFSFCISVANTNSLAMERFEKESQKKFPHNPQMEKVDRNPLKKNQQISFSSYRSFGNEAIFNIHQNLHKKDSWGVHDNHMDHQMERWKLLEKLEPSLERMCARLNRQYKKMKTKNHKHVCTRFNKEVSRPRPVFSSPYVHLNSYSPQSVTLVVVLTPSRFSVFEQVLDYWTGPVSVSLYMECSNNFIMTLNRIRSWLYRDALDVHIVLGPHAEVYISCISIDYKEDQHVKDQSMFLINCFYIERK